MGVPTDPEPLQGLLQGLVLGEGAWEKLSALAARVVEDPLAPTNVRDPGRVIADHLADSLIALELPFWSGARTVADLGAGAGFPCLPLAAAVPAAGFRAIESNARKCRFIAAAAAEAGITNVDVVWTRAEEWAEGAGVHDVVTARALAPLSVVAEYAAPLLRVGGVLVAWRGRRDTEEEEEAARACDELGLALQEVVRVQPYPAATDRHLHVFAKVRQTPSRFPRRPGMARKRPLGTRPTPGSDRDPR